MLTKVAFLEATASPDTLAFFSICWRQIKFLFDPLDHHVEGVGPLSETQRTMSEPELPARLPPNPVTRALELQAGQPGVRK